MRLMQRFELVSSASFDRRFELVPFASFDHRHRLAQRFELVPSASFDHRHSMGVVQNAVRFCLMRSEKFPDLQDIPSPSELYLWLLKQRTIHMRLSLSQVSYEQP